MNVAIARASLHSAAANAVPPPGACDDFFSCEGAPPHSRDLRPSTEAQGGLSNVEARALRTALQSVERGFVCEIPRRAMRDFPTPAAIG